MELGKSVELELLGAAPLLMTESQQAYDAFVSALLEEIRPTNFIQRLFVRDVIDHSWHIRRLRWARIATINMSYRKAIVQLLVYEIQAYSEELFAEQIAEKWFTSEKTRAEIANLLKKYNLDESAIEAAAMKLASSDLEDMGKELAFWEACRNKALRNLHKQQARRVRAVTQQAIDSDGTSNLGQQEAAE